VPRQQSKGSPARAPAQTHHKPARPFAASGSEGYICLQCQHRAGRGGVGGQRFGGRSGWHTLLTANARSNRGRPTEQRATRARGKPRLCVQQPMRSCYRITHLICRTKESSSAAIEFRCAQSRGSLSVPSIICTGVSSNHGCTALGITQAGCGGPVLLRLAD